MVVLIYMFLCPFAESLSSQLPTGAEDLDSGDAQRGQAGPSSISGSMREALQQLLPAVMSNLAAWLAAEDGDLSESVRSAAAALLESLAWVLQSQWYASSVCAFAARRISQSGHRSGAARFLGTDFVGTVVALNQAQGSAYRNNFFGSGSGQGSAMEVTQPSGPLVPGPKPCSATTQAALIAASHLPTRTHASVSHLQQAGELMQGFLCRVAEDIISGGNVSLDASNEGRQTVQCRRWLISAMNADFNVRLVCMICNALVSPIMRHYAARLRPRGFESTVVLW